MAGVAPSFEFWAGEGSPVEWVVSRNLHRRHLSTSQRAMVAAGLVSMFEAEAHARQVASLKKGEAEPVSADLRSRDHGKSTEKAAAAVNVSPRSVESALKVVREAAPEVAEAVKRGEVAVSAAAKAGATPPESSAGRAPTSCARCPAEVLRAQHWRWPGTPRATWRRAPIRPRSLAGDPLTPRPRRRP